MDSVAESKADFGQTGFERQLYRFPTVCRWVSDLLSVPEPPRRPLDKGFAHASRRAML